MLNKNNRRHLIAVIGGAGVKEGDTAYVLATELGERLIDAGYRICNGGLTGVMTAVFQGAKRSKVYQEGDTVAIIPTLDHRQVNQYADIVIATGLGHMRNGLVAAAEAVVVVGGQAGTLSEMALAWQYNRLVIALSKSGGVAAQYADKSLDNRKHRHRHPALKTVANAETPQEAINIIRQNLPACYLPSDDFGGEW